MQIFYKNKLFQQTKARTQPTTSHVQNQKWDSLWFYVDGAFSNVNKQQMNNLRKLLQSSTWQMI